MRWSGGSGGGIIAGVGSSASKRCILRVGVIASGWRDVMAVSGLGDVSAWTHVTRSSSLNHRRRVGIHMSLGGVGHIRSSVRWLGDSGRRSIWVIVLVCLSDCLYTSISASSSMLVDGVSVCDATAYGLNLLLGHRDGDCLVWWGIILGIVCDGDGLHWSVDVGYGDVLRCGGCAYVL